MTPGEELKEFCLPLNVSTSISLRVSNQLFMFDPDTREVSMVIKRQGHDMEVFDQKLCLYDVPSLVNWPLNCWLMFRRGTARRRLSSCGF